MTEFRPATPADLAAITEIYNEAILHTVATMDTEPQTLDDRRRWLTRHDDNHPVLVAAKNGTVVGWASLNEWSDRPGYAVTAEVSLFIHPDHRGRGIGKQLLHEVLEAGRRTTLRSLVARIADENIVSLNLFRAVGFEDVGLMREVGKKFDRLIDIWVLQHLLGDRDGIQE